MTWMLRVEDRICLFSSLEIFPSEYGVGMAE